MSHLKSLLEESRKRNMELEEKVEEGLKKVRDSREEQANIEERLRKELVSQVREMERGERCVLYLLYNPVPVTNVFEILLFLSDEACRVVP